ncbi:MAG: hypothetical protein K2L87_03930 [Clostridiales bacterium]|nr:hypothetical protein [Clostridiales bacterium]
MKKVWSLLFTTVCLFTACGCAGDLTSDDPHYHETPDADEKYYTFLLELREPSTETVAEEGDIYPHSTLDGALIYSWEIPMYGNTVYESVTEYFKDRTDSITFRLSQQKFYMFHDCTLPDGTQYNLETVYIAADGEYAMTANYQPILGEDGVAGTEDDLKVLTLVYRGWLY